MKYFKLDGVVSAFENDGSQDHLIKPEMVEMTAAEVELHRNPPAPEKSIQDKIDDLENSVTIRNMLGSLDGDQYAIDEIKKVRAEIAILRAKL